MVEKVFDDNNKLIKPGDTLVTSWGDEWEVFEKENKLYCKSENITTHISGVKESYISIWVKG